MGGGMDIIKYIVVFVVSYLASRKIANLAEIHINYKEELRGSKYDRGYDDGMSLLGVHTRSKIYSVLFTLSMLSYVWYFESLVTSLFYGILTYMLFVTAEVDIQVRIISNEFVLGYLLVGIVYRVVESILGLEGYDLGVGRSILDALGGLFFVFVMFMVAGWLTSKLIGTMGVGAGDVKMMSALALIPGMSRLPLLLINFLIFLSIFALWGVRSGVLKRGGTFPFGVQLAGGFMMYLAYLPVLEFIGIII